MTAPRVVVREVACFEWPFTLRLPFRFGAITVTHGRQAVVRVRVALEDGREAWGMAAESLAAKWFDKNPALSDEQNLEQLRRALEIAADAYLAHGAATAFGLFSGSYEAVLARAGAEGLPKLAASYGPALLDRCIADAIGRLDGVSFFTLVQNNVLGIAPASLAPDLGGFSADRFLAALEPRASLHARHTVGLVDPLTDADRSQPLGDGLPETLQEVVAAYGQRYFKLKVSGVAAAGIDRLARIAAVLDTIPGRYHATLDGNEQYDDAAGVAVLLRAIEAEPRLARLRQSLLFVEQPIRRARALDADVSELARFAPLLLDESDGDIDVFAEGRRLGYGGISSKVCKGFYKSLINRMRCEAWGDGSFMSGEDLTTLAGTSVQQDLTLVSLLGLGHVERNGHHFVDGFSGQPAATADAFLAAHPALYHRADGQVRLTITEGQIAVGSLGCPGFGAAVHPDTSAMATMPRSKWP